MDLNFAYPTKVLVTNWSASLSIPGHLREEYDWQGSSRWYKTIRGIYVPEQLKIVNSHEIISE